MKCEFYTVNCFIWSLKTIFKGDLQIEPVKSPFSIVLNGLFSSKTPVLIFFHCIWYTELAKTIHGSGEQHIMLKLSLLLNVSQILRLVTKWAILSHLILICIGLIRGSHCSFINFRGHQLLCILVEIAFLRVCKFVLDDDYYLYVNLCFIWGQIM